MLDSLQYWPAMLQPFCEEVKGKNGRFSTTHCDRAVTCCDRAVARPFADLTYFVHVTS